GRRGVPAARLRPTPQDARECAARRVRAARGDPARARRAGRRGQRPRRGAAAGAAPRARARAPRRGGVSPADVLDALVARWREAGLEVRRVRGIPEAPGEPPARSGLCRVRGAPWLVLSDADGLDERIAAAADALRRSAPDLVAARYLPPAVRERLADEPDAS